MTKPKREKIYVCEYCKAGFTWSSDEPTDVWYSKVKQFYKDHKHEKTGQKKI